MIVVLDTNIIASATYWRGKPAHCLEAWVLGKYDLAISHPILSEYEDVIARLSVRYSGRTGTDWLNAVKRAAYLYLPGPISLAVSDPKDQMFLECSDAAKADYLVTGDRSHILPLNRVGSTTILSVSDFLKELGVPDNPT
jgi:putative PIN family toxin of toxin-antitoxin system